jgi:hypothetical protein
MHHAKTHYRRWLLQAPLGLIFTGFGACLIAEAANLKFEGANTLIWVGYGTMALVVFNSGLSIFGGAILHRVRYESMKDAKIE